MGPRPLWILGHGSLVRRLGLACRRRRGARGRGELACGRRRAGALRATRAPGPRVRAFELRLRKGRE